MNKRISKRTDVRKIILRKYKSTRMILDKETQKPLFKVEVEPIEERYGLSHPILTGVGSLVNIAGETDTSRLNYFSSRQAHQDIASIWKQVGAYVFDAMGQIERTIK
ncbi:MAG: hypothetical protein LBM06_05230 [Prevotellaceae bacterium]|jgi:hypothetical protein|nr:hypothetical protein [Prevotellaceae bacterium]